jgi:hypothetical protein
MKRVYGISKLLVAALVVATCAEAYARTEVSHKGGVDAPQRTLQRTDDGITVAYTFAGNAPSACNVGDGGCVWRIEGFGLRDAPGGYATPFRVDAFAVPEGCTAVVETVDSAFVDYDCRLAPARRIPEKGTAAEGVVKEGGQNASQGGFFPRNVAAAAGRVDVYRGREICNVVVNPVQYDAAANKARAYSKITYKVRFVPKAGARAMAGAPATKPVILPADNMLGNIIMNGASAKAGDMAVKATGVAAGDDTRDYLIISVNKYAEAVDRFAEWKELLGFRVHKVLKGSWNSDAVKAEVEKAYAENPALYYLLIVGDHDDVPGQYMEHHADDGDFSVHYTDLYYGCMDGECDETPDIYRGRLSVSSPEEAATVVDKIIGYEKRPPTDAGFYERGVNCADYLDNDNGVADDYEDRRYVQTAEEIRAYMLGQGKDVERVYSTNYEITPKYWNRNYFSFGEPIPEDMLKPAFAWDGNEGDIRRAINSGVFYVLHRDHGLVDCWENPYFSMKHVDMLQNGDLLPVVFCVNCDNGAFQADCLAERFLRKQGGGAVAVIAASDISYSGYNDALACGLFDAIWPEPGLRPKFPGVNSLGGETPAPTYELGQILDQAQVRVSETFGSPDPSVSSNEKNDSFCRIVTKEIYHCFGDPSMQIRTEMPAPFSGVSVTRGNGCVTVGNGGETARITFVNRRTGEVVSHIAPSAVYTTADFEDVDVCVSGHNRIPYIDAGKLTGIESVQTDKAAADGDGPMYDLSGIRLYKEPQKGIYIKGHKKTVAGER